MQKFSFVYGGILYSVLLVSPLLTLMIIKENHIYTVGDKTSNGRIKTWIGEKNIWKKYKFALIELRWSPREREENKKKKITKLGLMKLCKWEWIYANNVLEWPERQSKSNRWGFLSSRNNVWEDANSPTNASLEQLLFALRI